MVKLKQESSIVQNCQECRIVVAYLISIGIGLYVHNCSRPSLIAAETRWNDASISKTFFPLNQTSA